VKHPFAKVLVVHPHKIMAEFIAGLLQHYGINALPLTSALDAIEHVENLYFDVALVSDWMPSAVPQLLFEAHRANWLEVLILHSEPLDDDPKFVLAVSEAVDERCWMCYWIAEAWHAAWYGEAGYEPGSGWTANLTEGELEVELERLLAASRSAES
jgi:CheY-like chemotaxis protein